MDTVIAQPQLPAIPLQAVGKSFGFRAGAYIIDGIVLAVTNLVTSWVVAIGVVVIYMVMTGCIPDVSDQESTFLDYFITFVMWIIFFTLFEWLYGATLGKLILKMRVVREAGSPCSFGSALLRAVGRGFLRLGGHPKHGGAATSEVWRPAGPYPCGWVQETGHPTA